MRCRAVLFAALLAMTAGCHSRSVGPLAEEFVYKTLAFSPAAATAAGLHSYQGKNLDQQLDDVSGAGFDRQRRFYRDFQNRLNRIRRDRLSPEDQADYDILQDQTALGLLDLDTIQSYIHNPTMYVELIGNALFTPWVLDYAPRPKRVRDIIARLRQIPFFIDVVKGNLVNSPDIWTKVAEEENSGNIDLIQKTIAPAVPPDLRRDFDAAAAPALKALGSLQDYLTTHLARRNNYDWRLGKDTYRAKFRHYLETDADPSELLVTAEGDLVRVRRRMYDLALPIYRQIKGGDSADEQAVISTVLARIAEKHSTVDSYMADARRDLDEARAFVRAKHLVTLPARSNLQVIETPEFMRGIYAVGGFNPAPALEPLLGAFYWITPIPKDWPAERVQSKLREYNWYNLKLLTIHEAMPGHYVQAEVANDVQPRGRRLLRAVYGNGPYIEGWAQYATQMMLDNSYLDNSPELRLTMDKQELRVLANTIMDVRLHTLGMSDEEAMDLMEKQTFQEHEEAAAKLQRAKLSSCQLPTYLIGWRGWLNAREQYRRGNPGFRLEDFNDRALHQGAVPLGALAGLLNAR